MTKARRERSVGRSRLIRVAAAGLTLLAFCGCGGGGGSSGSGAGSGAPSGLSYPSASAFTVGTAISPLAPTVTGTVTHYSVSPSLPAGLTLNASSGVISGTPTTATPTATYTVVGSNSAGQASDTITLQVDAVAPLFSYSSVSYTFPVAGAVSITPTSLGGPVVSWSVAPGLPAGLTLDASTGTITGTPTVPSVASTYMVTGQNSGGSYKVGLSVQVASRVLLDLGHVADISTLLMNGTRALSADGELSVDQSSIYRCNLWNTQTDTLIAALQCGEGQLALAGPTVVLSSPAGFPQVLQVLASSSGQLQAALYLPYSWWRLAADGSYIAIGSASALSAYSPTGQLLFSHAGNYAAASAFAAPGQILVALGPKGANVIETVSLQGGASSVGPAFQGTFNEWFLDGSHFQTATSTTVWTYSAASVQVDITSLGTVQGLGGEGNWFWTVTQEENELAVYAVGASSSPALVNNSTGFDGTVVPSGTTIGLIPYGTPQITIVDLSGASPVQNTYALPIAYDGAYAALSASSWFVGNGNGVVLDGRTLATTPTFLTLGTVHSIAGSSTLAAVATASGQIVVLNPQTGVVENTIAFASGEVQMSTDGTVLAAQAVGLNDSPYEPDQTLKVFSLPSGTLINSWPYTFGDNATGLLYWALAPTGTLIGQLTGQLMNGYYSAWTLQVTAVSGGPVLFSESPTAGPYVFDFSPDGTLLAVATGLYQAPGTAANIYQNFQLITAVSGWPVGWVSNSELLTNTYAPSQQNYPLGIYSNANLYSSSGTALPTPTLPELINLNPISSAEIYSPSRNSIYSLSNGALLFGNGALVSAGPTFTGAVVGSEVVFAAGSQVVADAF